MTFPTILPRTMLSRFIRTAGLLAVTLSCSVYSQTTPTAAQLQMFQSLPAAQQQALAAQYGVTLPASSAQSSPELASPEVMQPRSTASQPKPQTTQEQNKLSRFGIDLFSASPTTFAPVSDVPVPANYVVGPGDEIVVQLFGKENSTQRLRVNREGVINFAGLGPISVGGISFADVKALLAQRVEEQIIGVRSTISLGEMRSMQIFVMGEAYKPGAYTVSALTTISQAIYYSGGFAQNGALRDVELKRDGKTVVKLDLYDLLLKGDARNDVRLIPGDVVLINPVKSLVSLEGEVNRPAVYEVQPGERFADLLEMAGGFSPNAVKDTVTVTRIADSQHRNILTQDWNSTQALNQKLMQGDNITVKKRTDELKNYVQLQGDVYQPGYVEWKPGLRVNDLFQSLDSSFNSTADVNYALVVHEINQQHDIEVKQISLAEAILNPASPSNLILSARDKIVVFNRFSPQDVDLLGKTEDEAKSFEQAHQQAQTENAQDEVKVNITATDNFSAQEASLITSSNQIAGRSSAPLQKNTRRALLAPILMKLNQQASYGNPPLVAEVTGEVKHPGFYPISLTSRISDLVSAAGGLTPEAYISSSELARSLFSAGGNQPELDVQSINLQQAIAGDPQSNLQLNARDRLNVLARPNSGIGRSVVLKGEVRFPGAYAVRKGETLGQLLARAGGLTDFANPQGAIFTREALRIQEQQLLNDYAQEIRKESAKQAFRVDKSMASTITDPDKTLAFVEQATKSKALGRMVVQLDQVLDGQSDFMLEDGDFLFVPTFRNTISVMGEVQLNITYLLNDKLDVDDYINKAGGMKKQADEERIFVVRADGSVFKPDSGYWFGNHNGKLKAGDTIVVPLDTNYRDQLSIWTAATQILYQTGVAINALQ